MPDKLVRDNIVQFQEEEFVFNVPLDGRSMSVDSNAQDLFSFSECAGMGIHPTTSAGKAYKTFLDLEEEAKQWNT